MINTLLITIQAWASLIHETFFHKNNTTSSEKNSKHLLMIAWIFPPNISGGVYRPMSFARYAARSGWKVTVVCKNDNSTPTPSGKHLLEQIQGENIEIIRVNECNKRPSYRFFPRIDGGLLNAIEIKKEIEKKLTKKPDIILASGPPFHVFVAGKWLSNGFNCPLVLDLRDEWSICEFDFVQKGNADQWFEKRCLEDASQIIFTTKSSLTSYAEKYPELDESCLSVIHNGWEQDDFDSSCEEKKPQDVKKISFIGYMGDHTPAHDFLADLETVLRKRKDILDAFVFYFIGSKDEAAKESLSKFPFQDSIKSISHIPKNKATEAMSTSSALLLINLPRLHRYIPGKLFDYVASGTPILLYGDGGEVGNIVKNIDAGLITPCNNAQQLETTLETILNGFNLQDSPKKNNWLLEHRRSELAKKFIFLINKITNNI